mmetsp:Transcript_10590/g.12869  ORF Transcript_10590/g.12869 Transcript_10590/m.12869 type:complete len:109 (-) Transcript_10590:272-598(-)
MIRVANTLFVRVIHIRNLKRSLSGTRGSSLLEKLSAREPIVQSAASSIKPEVPLEACGEIDEEEEDEMEEMFMPTAKGLEWGGPMRGGRYYEPTRFGDWEQKGRCSDF